RNRLRTRVDVDRLIFCMPLAVNDEAAAIQRGAIVRKRHRTRRVQRAPQDRATVNQWLARIRGAIEDIHAQDVGRAIDETSCIGVDNVSIVIERDDFNLQAAVFLVYYDWY